jgi:hypothetical protein
MPKIKRKNKADSPPTFVLEQTRQPPFDVRKRLVALREQC